MFGRKKKTPAAPAASAPELAPDGPAPPLCSATPPDDVPGWYAAAGLPGLEPRRGQSNGAVVWRVTPPDAEAAWVAARELYPRTSLWPVLVHDDFWERFDDQTLEPETDRGDGGAWLSARLAEDRMLGPFPRRPGTDWDPYGDTTAAADVVAERASELVLVPAAAPWLVPGAIGWDGAVNSELMGPEHATVLRRWAAAYGAELVGLGSDTMVLHIGTPPRDREPALRAATEVATYCPDTVFQGVDTLDEPAENLVARAWRFWWD